MLLAILTILNIGCFGGDAIDRCVVEGNVNFNGAPLANGEIRFRGETGPISGSPIKDGHYRVDHKGGVPIGTHKVTVTAYRMLKTQSDSNGLEINSGGDEQFIPERYNKNSTLTAVVSGEERRQEIDFDLEL